MSRGIKECNNKEKSGNLSVQKTILCAAVKIVFTFIVLFVHLEQ